MLGPVELNGQGANIDIAAENPRRLLAALLLRANTWVSPDYLIEAVWPDNPPRSRAGNVKTYIHFLRGVVPPAGGQARIDSRHGGYRLRVERHECDATVFEDRVSSAMAALATAAPTDAIEQLRSALALWRGAPYEPLSGTEAEAEAQRLRALLWHTRYTLAETLTAAGQAGDAITLLWPLTTEDPLREKTWEHLLRALAADGRWAEVLVAFHQARQVLADELGVLPGPELRRLHELALRADQRPPARAEDEHVSAHHTDVTEVPRRRPAPGPRRWRWSALLALIVASAVTAVVAFNGQSSPSGSATDAGAPTLTFLSPRSGQTVSGIITIRVRVSDPDRLRQVDFHRVANRCPGGVGKDYLGLYRTPVNGVYEMTVDTRKAANGCLEFGAVGLDRDNPEILHPSGGTYVRVTVQN
ncbi:BTAD domain-containing putative transcriptional regulator [Actinophytocola sediminis]